MRKKKLLTAVISLALVILVALPGTLAVSNGQDSSDTPAETTAPVAEAEKTCTCDPAPAEGEAHKGDCPLYAAPEKAVEEAKTCTCDPAPAEGEAHKEGCPLHAAPEKAVEEAKTCTCGVAEEEAHKGDCPLYAAPEKAVEEAKTCTCDPAPAEGEAHKQGCPLYATPEKAVEEAKTCTCDPAPAEGEGHKEGCPLYAAPEQPAEEAKTCTCGVAEGEAHKADCPLFQHLETCGENCTGEDCECPCHLFNKIMACTTQEALEDLIAETPEEYFGLLSDEQIQKIDAHIKSLETVPLPAVTIANDAAEGTVPSEIVRPTVNYTYVAPFGNPVTGGNN